MKRIAIFASGSGSNAENIARYFSGSNDIEISLILSNKKEAFVHERAKKLGIPSYTFSKTEFDEADLILETLQQYEIDFIVLAGFLLKVPRPILEAFPNRIINIHPALLPKYGGKGMYGDRVHRAVIDAGEKESGISIHYVNEHYDEGNIIFQATCEVLPSDSPDDIAQKVHQLEYNYFPEVIEKIVRNNNFDKIHKK
ncbi:MAG TPA: phosphoribosylglycinamide formyltransferase [Petrimonas sp.]|uniref:phosphoribosylglycinamide formyltransferase n=1 Tax=Petrimonas sp. TaxID=2023866 RepID=UPI00095D520F|nr:MAG: phosphoribosylglycinamide formyltransferase [Bacteroidia bacterium 43-41]HHV85421.1 phosphoribosylglycinamide formyltransferase [Petrimonas sp.]